MFEWAIPEKFVLHVVSLQTLMERGLQERCFVQPPTSEIRYHTARELQRQGPWEIGLTLGFFARKFGARAPLNWVSRKLFHDCIRANIMDDGVFSPDCAHGHSKIVNLGFFCDPEDGIDTCLCEWWLADLDFFLDCEEFQKWREVIEDSMTWDLIAFGETWGDVDSGGIIRELSMEDKLTYDEEKNGLLVKYEKKRAAIEAEAVKIGL